MTYSAEGRALLLFKHAEVAKEEEVGDGVVSVSSMIGSRPPRCERRCIACGHCEAIQVPVVPPQGRKRLSNHAAINSRSDDTSNYKPMSWKCKCGNRILNP